MSGHSHFSTIKRKKAATDAQRSKLFSKLAGEITVAAREGGADPTGNVRLRHAIDKAKEANMPADNVGRAVKRGTGEGANQLQEVMYEAYGPGNIALLLPVITDNTNRTLGELKQILAKHQGKVVEGGGVRWLFERRGVLALEESADRENQELAIIEAGAEDLKRKTDGLLEVYTKPEALDKVKNALEEKGMQIESASLDWVPKEPISVSERDREAGEALFEALDEHDAVQEIYANIS